MENQCMPNADGRGAALAERLRKVMEVRGMPAREWCRRANLSPSLVASIIHRAQKGNASFSMPTIQALAAAADVSWQWLATGVGSMDAPSSPTELRVVRPDPEVEALEEALFRAKGRGDYSVADFDAARVVMRETYRHMLDAAAVDSYAEDVLRAAKVLRKEGQKVDTTAVLARMVFGTSKRQAEALDALSTEANAKADADLRAKGYEPGQGAASLQEALAKAQARRRRNEGE